MYSAVAPVYGGGSSSEEVVPDAPKGPPLSSAQQRLADLKAKLGAARGQNHKQVVEEDRRNTMGPEAMQKERAQYAYDKAAKSGKLPTRDDKIMNSTAASAELKNKADDKKEKHRVGHGWDVYNSEAQHRNYKKRVRQGAENGRIEVAEQFAEVGEEDPDADPLAYGEAPPVPKEKVQALVEDMHEAALRRTKWSRRRTFHEEQDVTYINKRNEVYNKKIQRAFDPYTAEIRANLERGTAL